MGREGGRAFRLLPATQADAAAIADLRNAVAGDLTRRFGTGHWSGAVSEKGILSDLRTSTVWVVRSRGRIIATLRLATKKPWAIDVSYFPPCVRPLYLTSMAVAPGRQRTGVGRRCLGHALRLARGWPAEGRISRGGAHVLSGKPARLFREAGARVDSAMAFPHLRSTMRPATALLAILFGAGCQPEQPDATPDGSEAADCAGRVERAKSDGTDSLFAGAGELVQSCPDAMAVALAALWSEPEISPARARTLRAVSALVRDQRLLSALESAVRDPGRPVETRAEALSTLTYHLQAGRWIEFTFLQGDPDSASLRMFVGTMERTISGEGSHPVPAGYEVVFSQLLESLRDTDSSSAMRSAGRRLLLFLDYSRRQLELQKQNPPAPPPPG